MEWIRLIIKALLIVLLQVVVFDRLQIQGWGYPMIYVLLLINLPVQIPRWAEMLIGAIVGLIIDICNNSLGVHMSACVALSFLRPILLKKSIQDVERIKGEINSQSIGLAEYIKCLVIMVLMHHLLVFSLEAWGGHSVWLVILHTLFSSLLTILMLLAYDYMHK
jgi:rod shape-determining protein MreD